MKRLICILLLFALLLTGCTVSDSTGDTCRAEDPVAVEEALEREPEQTPQPVPEDTQEPVTEPEPEPSGTTASGFTVHTDYSNYTPHTTPEPVFMRLTEDFIPDLQPSDDYGMLYPYIGSLLYSVGSNGYSYQAGERYGLLDKNGRIVADATYMEVRVLSYYDAAQYQTVEVPMLLLSRAGEATRVELEDWSYIDGKTLCGLASLDGSFVLPCEYGYVSAFADCVLVMEEYQADSFTVYDFEGTVRLTERDLAIDADRLIDWSYGSIQCGEGYYTIELSDGRWVMDSNGNLLHGPYYDVRPYSHGAAAASRDGEHYGFVDCDGNWIVEPEYDWAYSAQDGNFVVRTDQGQAAVLDRQGNTVFSAWADYIEITSYGYSTGRYSSPTVRHFDQSGRKIWETSGDWFQMDYRGSLYYRETDSGLELYNVSNGAQVVLENVNYLHMIHTGGIDYTPLDVPYITSVRTDDSICLISKEDFSVVLELSPGSWVGGLIDPITGTKYLYAENGGVFRLYDESLGLIGTYASVPYIYNDMLRTTDSHFCTWQDFDGNVFFRYSLATSLSD